MPFAGHPTLGSAHVARALSGAGRSGRPGASRDDEQRLEMRAGIVRVTAVGDTWTLRAAKTPSTRPVDASRADLCRMLGLAEEALAGEPLWVDTGVEQLVLPLRSAADVRAARPDPALLARTAHLPARGAALAYVCALDGGEEVAVRFFFTAHGAAIEDPATGSACANLGGYLVATGHPLPVSLTLRQGDAVGRPSRLGLRVEADRSIYVRAPSSTSRAGPSRSDDAAPPAPRAQDGCRSPTTRS
jgi:PhzF family phenazine biosynthesis protein